MLLNMIRESFYLMEVQQNGYRILKITIDKQFFKESFNTVY